MLRVASSRAVEIIWITGAWAVLTIAGLKWRGVPAEMRPLHPVTPIDGTHPGYAREWRFLNHARSVIPPGTRLTIVSPDPDIDMQLFMLALGVMHDSTPLPWSYWMERREAYSDQAEYLLTYLRDPPPEENAVQVARFEGLGTVFRRI